MGTDCKVKRRRYESVGDEARWLRRLLGIDRLRTFDITKCIEWLVGQKFGSAGVLHLQLFSHNEEDLAFVTFKPRLTLHVHREIWEDARLGEPKSRFILAHELGHLLLHGHYRQAFSDDEKAHMKSWPEEERAEPQANWFAEQFLAPDHLTLGITTAVDLCRHFDFPQDYSENRLKRLERMNSRLASESCGECGNFTLVQSGLVLKCQTCGATVEL